MRYLEVIVLLSLLAFVPGCMQNTSKAPSVFEMIVPFERFDSIEAGVLRYNITGQCILIVQRNGGGVTGGPINCP